LTLDAGTRVLAPSAAMVSDAGTTPRRKIDRQRGHGLCMKRQSIISVNLTDESRSVRPR
jgi:hypothetical protein